MAKVAIALRETDSGWRLESLNASSPPIELDEHLSDLDSALEEQSRTSGRRATSVLVLLSPHRLLFVANEQAEPTALKTRQAIKYLLEPELPWSAEQVILDYQAEQAPGGRMKVNAIAAQRGWIEELVAKLQQADLKVLAITADSLAVVQALRLAQRIPADCLVVLPNLARGYQIVRLTSNRASNWRVATTHQQLVTDLPVLWSTEQASEQLELPLDAGPPAPVFVPSDLMSVLNTTKFRGQVVPLPSNEGAFEKLASSLVSGRQRAWLDLCADRSLDSHSSVPPERALQRFVLATAFALIATGIALLWRGQRLKHLTDDLVAAQRTVFREAFPDASVPSAIMARLRSEHAKALGARTGDGTIPWPTAAPQLLGQVIEAIPADLEFSLIELNITRGNLSIDVELDSHAAAGALTAALEAQNFELSPPASVLLASGKVGAHLEARPMAGGLPARPAAGGGASAGRP